MAIMWCMHSDVYDKLLSGEIDASAHRHDLGNHSKSSCKFVVDESLTFSWQRNFWFLIYQ